MSSGGSFAGWSQQQVNEHNAKVARAKTLNPPLPVQPVQPIQLVSRPTTDEEKLNKLERAYHQLLKAEGHTHIWVQAITLKLANDCRLTADFVHINAQGCLVFTDVKGFQREDALIKMKMAARLYPVFTFVIVSREKGAWQYRQIKP